MDITCRRCGEPWDNDSLHEEVAERALNGIEVTYSEVAAEFRAKGCGIALRYFAGYGDPGEQCAKVQSTRTEFAGVLADLLGDDMDGAAALLEDAEFAGML